jgi:transporter family-2 protein
LGNLSAKLIFLLIAALAGMTMAIQGTFNSTLGKVIGLWEATFIVHLLGTVIVGLLLWGLGLGRGNFSVYAQAPWYTFLGGILSVVIIYTVVVSIPKLGVCNATTAIIVGQVLTACIIDHLGLFGAKRLALGWSQLAGLGLLATGAKLLLK